MVSTVRAWVQKQSCTETKVKPALWRKLKKRGRRVQELGFTPEGRTTIKNSFTAKVPITVESSQHHVGGVQWVDEVWWESVLLFNCVWPPKKGKNNSSIDTDLGTCTFMCSNIKQGFSLNHLALEVASLRTALRAPCETVSKTVLCLYRQRDA